MGVMVRHLLFKCPSLGLTVQDRLEVACDDERRDDYRSVECPGCGACHFVNEKTGKVLGQKEVLSQRPHDSEWPGPNC